jgi:hypothetical protein
MNKIFIGFFALVSASSFASTIKHENCKLYGAFYDSELNMILENKGYSLYAGEIQDNTLNLEIDSNSEAFDAHPLSVMACPAQNEKWAKFTNFASIQRFDGNNFFTLAKEKTNYQACLQSGGEGKAKSSMKRLLKNLPDCEVK